jgi:RNA polymerase sigma factor (sigma-70 family)
VEKENELLATIRAGSPKVLEQLYDEYRRPFLLWAVHNYKCDDDAALEVYQKAYTILYFNVKSGKLQQLTSSIKTYLFAVGKNLFYERMRDKTLQVVHIDDVMNSTAIQEHIDNSILEQYQNHHQKELVKQLLNKIGDPCRKMLNLIFIDGLGHKEVVLAMGYSDERVVRKRKSLCLKTLREMSVAFKNH